MEGREVWECPEPQRVESSDDRPAREAACVRAPNVRAERRRKHLTPAACAEEQDTNDV